MKKIFLLISMIAISSLCLYAQKKDVVVNKQTTNGIEYYSMRKGTTVGCMDLQKKVIIPLSRGYESVYPQKLKDNYPLTYQVKKNGFAGICDASGKEILSPRKGYLRAYYTQSKNGLGYIAITGKDNKKGVCDLTGNEIIAPKYESVIYMENGFRVKESGASSYTDTGVLLTVNNVPSKKESIKETVQHQPVAEDSIKVRKVDYKGYEYYVLEKGKYQGCMDSKKNVIIPLSREYELAYLVECEGIRYYIVEKGKNSGICDASGKEIISPKQGYSFACLVNNSDNFYYSVEKGGKNGACDMSGKEVITPKYYSVIYNLEGFSVKDSENSEYRETGVMLNSRGIASNNVVNRLKQVEDDGFVWYKLYKNGIYGAENANGKTLIPLSRNYTEIYYWDGKEGKKGYFECTVGDKEGVCTIDGAEIIPPKYDGVIYSGKYGFSARRNKDENFKDLNIILADNGLVQKKTNPTRQYVAQNNSSSQSYSHNHNHSHSANSGSTPKAQRIHEMNGYTDIIPQANGTKLMITHQICFHCKGLRMCSVCGGRGGIIHPFLGTYIPCTNCMSSGSCKYCRGTGEQVFQSVVDGQGNGYGVDMNGNVVTTGGSGGYSGSSSKRSSSSSNNRKKDYIEVIEYSPNYTGQDNSEWCDICKKIAPAHKHIKK